MPSLLIDQEKCLKNIARMAWRAEQHGLSFRPHCKSHQSAEISQWFRDFGVNSITVSSFRMATYFAEAGWEDILVAFPFQPGEVEPLRRLSEKCQVSILLDSPAALPFLNQLSHPVAYYMDVDTGYGRTGVRTENPELMEQIIVKAAGNPRLQFKGFYCHAGHSYKVRTQKEREAIHGKALADLEGLKAQFAEHEPRILYGDTPNCSTQKDFRGIDEITPGNFVFYDLMQHALGSCSLEDIAMALECPVAGKYHHRQQIVIHGGSVHFSRESLHKDGIKVYGQWVQPNDSGWILPDNNTWLTGLSQEHGVLENCGDIFPQVSLGDKLLFLPVHSCLTANLAKEYWTLDGQRIKNIHAS
jgi:D-serine deaminase-like pyridoxal phosphate-dependent protein